ncbi:Uncharacterised protein [Serratia odorifera]|uniref:Uncharacterized protein n=1 Tax=Serratia odorifera TaxID=618 RepID=A0A3S4HJ68_SEROD|nr:hypothetical protein [Serratia odorifera]VDZ53086.1 Uncharacterised protein [Serratia odorifera]
MYLLYRSRHLFSWLPALIVAGCLLFASQQATLKIQPRYDDTTMALALGGNAGGTPNARDAVAARTAAGADGRTAAASAGTDR